VWLIADRALQGDWFYSAIASSQEASVRKFPPPHDSELGQFVTFMYCKDAIRLINAKGKSRITKTTIEELPVLKQSEFKYTIKRSEPFHFR
ncbi:MAG: hypothetical protein MN733_42960, partial [Nitrososphaera sp.]|nr:hypothetical protein [Nitrososphaera sp.]